MSWTDPCSNCGQHRADCDCGNWNNYNDKACTQEVVDAAMKAVAHEVLEPKCVRDGIVKRIKPKNK